MAVVALTGTMWAAIAAHFAYDLAVGVLVGRSTVDPPTDVAAPDSPAV